MGVSIKDVAKKCGLAVSTVSRALNRQYGVSKETMEYVHKIADELGYVPNLQAKELVQKKSNLVGVIIPESDAEARPAFFEIIPFLNQTLSLYNKEVLIVTVTTTPRKYIANKLEMFIKARNLEGCIIFPGFGSDHPIYKEAKKSNYPIVVIEENVLTKTCSNIQENNVMGAYLAVKHLIDHGHKKIGFINGPTLASICHDRLKGYRQAMAEHSLPLEEKWIITSDFTGEGGAKSVSELIAAQKQITAIFFANDIMAIGAISYLSSKGINVPKDLSIVGYDGMFITRYTTPPLTTIGSDPSIIGIRTAELLMELINGGVGKMERTTPELIIRQSVKQI
ncbi:LacI family DNA-binding transcriptional regulator [Cytobacillus suaedae]|nr:LacI family DNA-binding transcriptional regulator [Cytobacillus suaedae]